MSTVDTNSSVSKETDAPLTYRVATLQDCEPLCQLINSCYRGESSRQGWTTEFALLSGQRLDVGILNDLIQDDKTIMLVFFDPIDKFLVGCAQLQHKPTTNSAYLGLLTVRPDLQARGYGKFIMSTAENYAVNNWNVEYIEMTVIIHRDELIAYYNRRGYVNTGRREPFPLDEPRFGIPKRTDLEFCVLKKDMNKT